MITASYLLLATIWVSQPAQTKTYTNGDLDLAFKYPSKWQLSVKRGDTKFTIPLKTGNATLEIYASTFRGTPEEWQEVQNRVNASLKREVERQWQEEILSVPLLLTKINYQQGAENVSTLVGLLYSARAKKLLFRLNSPAGAFEEAESSFRTALVTLQTTSGDLPKTDNPEVPLPADSVKPVKPKKPPVVISSSNTGGKVRLADQKVATSAGGVDVQLRIPRGWTATKDDAGFTLKNERLHGQASITVNSELDSPKPDQALIAVSGESMKQFSSVKLREEPAASRNAAGAEVTYVRRRGQGDLGEIVVWQVIGSKSGYYWLLTYRGTYAEYQKDKGLIEDLIDSASVEVPK